ncbi:MAG: putative lipid II flippase FtsW [Patescibacteria group bacterium]|jgi:cell division protein FtsW
MVDRKLLFLLGGLTVFGLAMLASASWPLGFDKFHDGYYFLKHQAIFGLIPGLVGAFAASRIPYGQYRKYAGFMLLASIGLLILVFIPGVGANFGSAKSWITVGTFSVQPSEIVKLTFLIYLAGWMEKRSKDDLHNVSTGLIPFIISLSVIMLLLILQPDTGSMAIIVTMSLVVYFVAGAPLRYFLLFGGLGVSLLWALFKISPYRAARFTTFLHPELDPLGIGYHINQAMLAIGSGGLFGLGYGHSTQKFAYLPEVEGDSIFAVVGEEMGFIFTIGFLLLYLAFLFRGIKIAEKAPDAFGKYLAIGIVAWFGIQAFVNIGAMVGVLPITGVPLPFISYGGTSLAVCLTAAGILLNISTHLKEE